MNTILSQWWHKIQGSLFSWLEEELGPLTEKQQQLVSILELLRVEQFLPRFDGYVGRPPKNRISLARAFVAKAVYNMTTTRSLIDRLESDIAFRRICGWERKFEIPDESTFSRAFAEFAKLELPQKVHQALISKIYQNHIVGHVSRDSTAIEGRERPMRKKPKNTKPKKRGRPSKGEKRPKDPTRIQKQLTMTHEQMLEDLPKPCDVGTKKNSKGYKESWIGYKLHIDAADGDIPLSCVLTSASVHDSQVALPLTLETSNKVVNLYDLMDSAYDVPEIKEVCFSLGHIPIIDINPRRNTQLKEELELENKAQKNLNWKPCEKIRYNQRSSVERVNGNLKENFGGCMVRVRGYVKVACHLMFGILALTADQLLNLVR